MLAVAAQGQRAALASHLQRLQQVHAAHLRQVAAHCAVAGRFPRHLLQCNLVDGLLDVGDRFFQEKRFLDKIFHRIAQHLQFFADVVLAGQQHHRDFGGAGPPFDFFQQLAAVHSRHVVIANDEIGQVVNGFHQGVATIGRSLDVGQFRKLAPEHFQHHRIVIHQ